MSDLLHRTRFAANLSAALCAGEHGTALARALHRLAWALLPRPEFNDEFIEEFGRKVDSKIEAGDEPLLAPFYALALELIVIECEVEQEMRADAADAKRRQP